MTPIESLRKFLRQHGGIRSSLVFSSGDTTIEAWNIADKPHVLIAFIGDTQPHIFLNANLPDGIDGVSDNAVRLGAAALSKYFGLTDVWIPPTHETQSAK